MEEVSKDKPPPVEITAVLAARLLAVILDDVVPLTAEAVKLGNKLFGAALLRKSDLRTYLAATNNEVVSPLHHGEMHLLKHYYEIPSESRLPPSELLFLSTHEPCSLCLSAITWGGFDNFFYFFSHEDSRDSFAIPHDLKILKEVFDCDAGAYHHENAFWRCYSVRKIISDLAEGEGEKTALMDKVQMICTRYDEISETYQASKSDNDIPLK